MIVLCEFGKVKIGREETRLRLGGGKKLFGVGLFGLGELSEAEART